MSDSDKPYTAVFSLNAKLISIIYVCYKYKFPLQFMLTFYELYGDISLFALKALTCSKKISLSDVEMVKIIEESRKLYNQIQSNITKINKVKELKKEGKQVEDFVPTLSYHYMSEEFTDFVKNYLLVNIEDIYSEKVKLKMSTSDIYSELK